MDYSARDGETVGGFGGAEVLLKLLQVFAINLTERVMTISKSFELSSAPTCQNLDKSPWIHFSCFFSPQLSASLDTVQKVTNAGGGKKDGI